jgi:hypothetical protein
VSTKTLLSIAAIFFLLLVGAFVILSVIVRMEYGFGAFFSAIAVAMCIAAHHDLENPSADSDDE